MPMHGIPFLIYIDRERGMHTHTHRYIHACTLLQGTERSREGYFCQKE